MDPHLLKKLNAARRARQAAVMITDLGDGRDRLVMKGDPVAGALGEAVANVLASGKSGAVETEGSVSFSMCMCRHRG
jgi:xanthine dehydrogenase accessory factor